MINLNIDLTDKEAGYLSAAILDFLHKMHRAADEEFRVIDLDERIQAAKSLWHKIEQQIGQL